MPSSITHTYIGLDTLKKLNDKPRKIIEKHLDNYKVYCQNMDPLYFYHILLLKKNKIQDLGHAFHKNDVYRSLSLLINDNKKNHDEELFTFIAGLITHYQADSTIHPYVNYLSRNLNERIATDIHFEVETYIDNYFVNERLTKKYQKYNQAKFLFNYKKEKIIEEELNKVYQNIFNYSHIGKRYYQALREMKFVFKYIRHDSFGIKKTIFRILDLNPFNIKRTRYLSYHFPLNNNNYYLNLAHDTWYNPDNKKQVSNKSFFDLYDDVIKKTSKIINELYDYIYNNKKIDLVKLIGNNSYATGLPLEK